VDRLHHSPIETERQYGQTGLPRRLLRHLIVSHGIGVGSRVLDAGCGSGELAGYLSLLGIDVTGLDSSPIVIAAARQTFPKLDFHLTCSEHDILPPDRLFDLVIVRELSLYDQCLASKETLGMTARLLSGLRPGGTLVFLTPTAVSDDSSTHTTACYRRHLSGFPGNATSMIFQNGILQQFIPGWLSRRRAPSGHLLTGIQIPSLPLKRSEWLRHAKSAAAKDNRPCCRQADQSTAQDIHSRAA